MRQRTLPCRFIGAVGEWFRFEAAYILLELSGKAGGLNP